MIVIGQNTFDWLVAEGIITPDGRLTDKGRETYGPLAAVENYFASLPEPGPPPEGGKLISADWESVPQDIAGALRALRDKWIREV